MLTSMSATDEDFDTPILPGGAPSDYERYLNTEELLGLQKGPDEWVHRDELLFQVVHQSSELWLKLATSDVEEAARLTDEGQIAEAARHLRRPLRCLRYATDQLDMLEELSPWEYQEIRKVLGHGSGFDSPGWRSLRAALPRLGQAFHARRREAGLSLADLYVQRRDHDALYRLAESLIELDEWCQTWRVRHYRVVARVIGDAVVGYAAVSRGRGMASLAELYTEPEARGVGVGDAMLRVAEALASQWGCAAIESVALPGDRDTKNFFEAHGMVSRLLLVSRTL